MLWIFLLVLAGLRFADLASPAHQYFDEIYYVGGAHDFLAGRPDSNNVHPPLGKLEIAAGIWLVQGLGGPEPLGWRLASAFAGLGSLVLTWCLARQLLNQRAAWLAVALVGLDFLQHVQSRVAMLDELQCFWILAGFVLVAARPRAWEWTSALCFGCATACKWNGLFAAAAAAAGIWWQTRRFPWRLLFVFGITLPSVYLASYAPHFLRGGSFSEVVGFHQRMWDFRYNPAEFQHRYLSSFWSWPLIFRPVWYLFEQEPERVRGIVALGNPLFWGFGLLLLLDQLLNRQRRASWNAPLVVCAILLQWLPWATATTGGFLYYMLPITPFYALLVARELDDWFNEPLSRALAVLYLVSLLASFAAFLPFLNGWWVPRRYFEVLFFLPGWK